MAEFIVCINRSTYYRIEAENEIEAIDNILDDGHGEEIAEITLDAFISSRAELGASK